MDLEAAPAPLSSFGPYRRRQALAAIARQLQQPAIRTATVIAPTLDLVALQAGMDRRTASPDPLAVFTHLAALLVPEICDEAIATVYRGQELDRWRQQPARPERPTARISRAGPGWTLTVPVTGQPAPDLGESAEPDYVAELTCHGGGEPPSATDVALIKFAGHSAATSVHRARQAELLRTRAEQITDLRAGLITTHFIGAAVGVLMAEHDLPYQRAVALLSKMARESNSKLDAVARTIVHRTNPHN